MFLYLCVHCVSLKCFQNNVLFYFWLVGAFQKSIPFTKNENWTEVIVHSCTPTTAICWSPRGRSVCSVFVLVAYCMAKVQLGRDLFTNQFSSNKTWWSCHNFMVAPLYLCLIRCCQCVFVDWLFSSIHVKIYCVSWHAWKSQAACRGVKSVDSSFNCLAYPRVYSF